MKFFELFVCLMATAMVSYATTIADIALYGGVLSTTDLEECYEKANLQPGDSLPTEQNNNIYLRGSWSLDVLTNTEINDGSYKSPENEIKTRRNGCLTLCILRKRGQIVDQEIQEKKLYGKLSNALLNPGTQAKMYATINRCIEQVQTKVDMCAKSLDLLTCIWRNMI